MKLKMDRIDEVGMPTCDEKTEYEIRIMMNGRGPQTQSEIELCNEWIRVRAEYMKSMPRESGIEAHKKGGMFYKNRGNVFRMANEELKLTLKKRRAKILWMEGLEVKEICETLQSSKAEINAWLGA
jgi:hypothetical protein